MKIKDKEQQLRLYFTAFEQRLKDSTAGHKIYGQSDNALLEESVDDDAYYGHLHFDEDGLGIAYRTREEDMERAFTDEPWEPIYCFQRLDKCSAKWLRALSVPKIIESLLANMNMRVEQDLTVTNECIQTLSATANLPLRDLGTGLVEAAKQLNLGAVIEHWQDAKQPLGVDPPDATTRACSMIETSASTSSTLKKRACRPRRMSNTSTELQREHFHLCQHSKQARI